MDKNVKQRVDKPKGNVKYTKQDSFTAKKRLCDKVVITGIAITGLAFATEIILCAVEDHKYRKQIKTKAKNG
jgi:hypothetical protein